MRVELILITLIAATGIFIFSVCETTPELSSSHGGWGNPDCKFCHTDAHHREKDPYQCAECHGTNGAGARPGVHWDSGCEEEACHGVPHADDGFPVPDSCLFCHE